MKLTLILILFTSTLFAQKNRTDIGGGDSDKLGLAIFILDKIEKKQEIKIADYFLNKEDFNEQKWKRHIKKIQTDFPNQDNSLTASDVNLDEKLWYERTYYERLDNGIKYHFQVYFELVEIDKEIKITKMVFKEADKIINRDREIAKLGDRSIPPPPPAIPDFE